MAPSSVRTVDVVGSENTILSATKNAASIAELITTIPHTWRPSLGADLTRVYRVASKLSTVQNTIAQYERHVAEGSFPASISNSLKEPKLQFSKEHLGTESGRLISGTFGQQIQSARKSLLDCALREKREELSTLQGLIAFDQASWRKTVLGTAIRVSQALGSSVTTTNVDDAELAWGAGSSSGVGTDSKMLWKWGNVFHYRAIALARSIADRSLVEKVKTLTLKKETDVEMRDIDSEKPTRELVREEMQAQMRLLETRLSRTFNQRKKPAPPKKKGGSNPRGVTKGPNSQRKGKGKGKK